MSAETTPRDSLEKVAWLLMTVAAVGSAWCADRSAGRTRKDPPFARAQYHLADDSEGQALGVAAESAISDANAANVQADLYVLHTVFFALSLVFLGATSHARYRWMRPASLVLGTLIFSLTVASLARQPREANPRLEHRRLVSRQGE